MRSKKKGPRRKELSSTHVSLRSDPTICTPCALHTRRRSAPHLSRREFAAVSIAASVVASLGCTTLGKGLPVIEREVDVETSDGTCDAAFFHPSEGVHPGVLIWPDSLGLRPALRELGRRIASEGYAALVPNHLYRTARAPVFDDSFDMNRLEDREKYSHIMAPFLAAGAAERDAMAFVAFLDAQPQVDTNKKIGTHGYCLGGAYVLKTAAALPDRVGAAASFHGGFLVTDTTDSPHRLAPKIKARLYIAIASDDDEREPAAKTELVEAFAAANVRAEVEVYPNALHGWCVPGNEPAADNKQDADRAWAKLVALYADAL